MPSSGSSYAPFYTLPSDDGGTLFINDSPEYRIKVMDTSTGEILRIFTRKYKRVKAPDYPPIVQETRGPRKNFYMTSTVCSRMEHTNLDQDFN